MVGFTMSVLSWAALIILVVVFFASGNVPISIKGPKKAESKSARGTESGESRGRGGALVRILCANFLFLLKYTVYGAIISGVVSWILTSILWEFHLDDARVHYWISFVICSLLSILWLYRCGFYMCRESFLRLSGMSYRRYSNILLIFVILFTVFYFFMIVYGFQIVSDNREMYTDDNAAMLSFCLVPTSCACIVFPLGFMFLRGRWGKRFVCSECKVFVDGEFSESSHVEASRSNVYIEGDDVHVGTLKTEGGHEVKVYQKAPGHYEEKTYYETRDERNIKCVCHRCGARKWVETDIWNIWDSLS